MLHLSFDRTRHESTLRCPRAPRVAMVLLLSLWGGTSWAVDAARKAPTREASKKSLTKPKRRPAGVRAMHEAAQELFDAGKYDAAVNASESLLRKYPGYEAAILLLARAQYKLDHFRDASIIFDRVNLSHLDTEGSYEYGWTYYSVKNWEKALAGFKRVTPGHALYDLANYYGGICALKLKKYDDAEDLFEKAVVLPDKLARSRSVYIKHIQALRLMHQKSQLAKERESEREALEKTPPKRKAKDDKNNEEKSDTSGVQPTAVAPNAVLTALEPEKHLGFRGTPKYAFTSFESQRQLIDNFGTKRGEFEANVTSFDFGSGPQASLPIILDGNRKAALGFNLALNAEYRVSRGEEQRLVIDERSSDRQRILSKEQPTKHQKSGRWTAGPWIEFPLPLGLWTALSGEASYKYPNFEKKETTGSKRGTVEIGGITESGQLGGGLRAYYQELTNPKSQLTTALSGAQLGGFVELPSHLALGSTVGYEVYDYQKKQLSINGPDSLGTFDITAVQAFPLGFTLRVSGTVEKNDRYVFFEMPTYDSVVADGTAVSGLVVLALGPQLVFGGYPAHAVTSPSFVPFLQAQVSGLVRKTYWDLANKEAREVFEYNVPDYIERVSVRVSLNLSF